MKDQEPNQNLARRDFLKGAVVGGAQPPPPSACRTARRRSSPPRRHRPRRRPAVRATRSSISRRRRSSRRWSTTWCRPTSSRPRAPTSASTSISTARSPAPGARATASTCRGRGSRACRARATSCRSRPRSSIAPASRRPTPIAARPTASTFDRLDEAAARGSAASALSAGKITFDSGLAGARVLDHALSDRDGRHVRRPDLRRQPQQGGLEADRLPRRDRGASRERREISRQEIPDQSASASRT